MIILGHRIWGLLQRMKSRNKNQSLLIGLFLIYLLFNGILLILHEPWRDEANVWLMARELSPLELLREIKYQGHPCLWYFLVMPFAKIGLPFRTIGVISYCIMAVTAWIFLQKAPIHVLTKAVCLLSPVFTYFYADIARNYCLIALILMLSAWQFAERNTHIIRYGLLLGLLVQADTIAIPVAGLISAMWLFENIWQSIKVKHFEPMKKILSGIWIPAVSLFFWFLQFYQVSDSPQFQMRELGLGEMLREIRNFSFGILIRMTGAGQDIIRLFFACCLIVFVLVSIKLRNGWAFGVLLGSFLFYAAFSAMVYQLHIWHYISLGFVFLWAIWIIWKQMEEKSMLDKSGKVMLGLLEGLMILLAVFMTVHWNSQEEPSNLNNALHGVYSDGGNAAAFIRENISPEEIIVTDNIPQASTIVAYLGDYEFYYAGNGKMETYADWSEDQSRSISYGELIDWARKTFPDKKEFFLIQTVDSCISEAEALEKGEVLYQSQDKTVRGEEYQILKIQLWTKADIQGIITE